MVQVGVLGPEIESKLQRRFAGEATHCCVCAAPRWLIFIAFGRNCAACLILNTLPFCHEELLCRLKQPGIDRLAGDLVGDRQEPTNYKGRSRVAARSGARRGDWAAKS